MSDDRIYDAINVFKYSRTGQGTASIGGDDVYRRRYRVLAREVVTKLWELWSANEIAFAALPETTVGDSQPQRAGADIRVNNRLEPSANAATYATPAEQGKLAACSGNLVHEATHLVRSDIASYPEQEVLCRTLQLFYVRELMEGFAYQSRVTGARLTAKFLPSTPLYSSYQRRLNRLASRDLIDSVFDFRTYRSDLESPQTADFVARSLAWWGGLSTRWPSTKGYFLRSLAAATDQNYGEKILQVLEGITAAEWPAAKACAGSLVKIRAGLAAGHKLYDVPFCQRITSVQETLGENFGISPR